MKQSFLAIAIILLFTQGVYAQTEQKPKGDIVGLLVKSDEEQITDIHKMTEEIKAHLGSYTKTRVMNDSTGNQYNYKNGKELKLVSISTIDKKQNLTKIADWYFHNGQLIYVEQNYKERSSNSIIDTEKFYLNREQLFAWFQGGTWKDVNSPEFKQVAGGLSSYAAQLKAESMK